MSPGCQVLMQVLRERGLTLRFLEDGSPAVSGNKDEATPALMNMLRLYRGELIVECAPRPAAKPIECRWNNGFVGRHAFPEAGWPTGAWWWRQVGETAWKPIPGTPGETQAEPTWGNA